MEATDSDVATEPPWITRQLGSLLQQRGHAWLLAGPSGLGQYRLGLAMVRAWLCDSPRSCADNPSQAGACGICTSCHAIDVRAHTDLFLLMPETVMETLGWPLSETAQKEIDDKKRKPSKEIRVDAMRDAVEFTQRTSGRGRGKAVLVFPAERMNNITANTLLKTLEEPPGDVRFVLASESAHQLLPTIRSRCIGHTMLWPDEASSLAWLQAQGIAGAQAPVLLRAAGGRPFDALQFANASQNLASFAAGWAGIPAAMLRGDVSWFKDWSAAQCIDALQKLCHDLLAVKTGATPRFFEATHLAPVASPAQGQSASVRQLTHWSKDLVKARRSMEHPYNAGLMTEALVDQAKNALQFSSASKPVGQGRG